MSNEQETDLNANPNAPPADLSWKRKLQAQVFQHRGVPLLLLAVPIVYSMLTKGDLQLWEAGLGLLLAVMAISLRLLAIRRIGKNARVRNCDPHTLICTGPFAWTRNPLYLANILMLTALAVTAGNEWVSLGIFVIGIFCYWPVILWEQTRLEEELGAAYQSYKAKVPALLPWRAPYNGPETAHAAIVPWGEVLRREKSLIPGIGVAYGALILARTGVVPVVQWVEASGLDHNVLHTSIWAVSIIISVGYSITSERKRSRRALRKLQQRQEHLAREAAKAAVESSPVLPAQG
ncbi:MAG: isoprenylcysteine carboxylmethyltransferase family protein [Planctomycetota bacterium]|nr:isoprenylcysteine carboxylmethyltransferase family protein [Planctomycetota bacterium]